LDRKSFNLDFGTLSVAGEDELLSAFISVNFSGTRFRLSSFRLTVVSAEHNGKVLSCRRDSRQFILAAPDFGSGFPLRLRHGIRLRLLSVILGFVIIVGCARSFVLFARMTCALASAHCERAMGSWCKRTAAHRCTVESEAKNHSKNIIVFVYILAF